jgi:hypothetical protein
MMKENGSVLRAVAPGAVRAAEGRSPKTAQVTPLVALEGRHKSMLNIPRP